MSFILDLIFPKKCVGCKKVGSFFCVNCITDIKQTDLVCPKCERLSLGGLTHPACKRKFGLDALWSLGIYDTPLKSAIQKLKYRWIKSLAEDLTDITIDYWARYQPLLLDQIKKDHGNLWLIVPVPLHKIRQNWRGFNQSAELGKLLSKKTGLKYSDCLIRLRNTRKQVGLPSHLRHQNIKGAFTINPKLLPLNSNVILVDDVWTTGSTLKECTYILKKSGAKKVWALTLAR